MGWLHWALLSAAFAGLTAVLAKAGVREVESNLATAVRTTVVLVLAWAVALVGGSPPVSSVPRQAWLFLVLSGLATGASWLCYFRALQLGDASRVAPVDKLSVVIAMLLAAAFLHERLAWQHGAAGLLIVSGTVLLVYA